ncbi:MAG TPA: carbon storage regulator [Bryobacteraceae bacterium]|nr:carbon storage regulator [Bryobacteraceae bacterium]
MLILRRRVGEAIIVAGDVEIEIIEISRTRVKLGITAPRGVAVTRREAAAIASENHTAAGLLKTGVLETDLVGLLANISTKMAKTDRAAADM